MRRVKHVVYHLRSLDALLIPHVNSAGVSDVLKAKVVDVDRQCRQRILQAVVLYDVLPISHRWSKGRAFFRVDDTLLNNEHRRASDSDVFLSVRVHDRQLAPVDSLR